MGDQADPTDTELADLLDFGSESEKEDNNAGDIAESFNETKEGSENKESEDKPKENRSDGEIDKALVEPELREEANGVQGGSVRNSRSSSARQHEGDEGRNSARSIKKSARGEIENEDREKQHSSRSRSSEHAKSSRSSRSARSTRSAHSSRSMRNIDENRSEEVVGFVESEETIDKGAESEGHSHKEESKGIDDEKPNFTDNNGHEETDEDGEKQRSSRSERSAHSSRSTRSIDESTNKSEEIIDKGVGSEEHAHKEKGDKGIDDEKPNFTDDKKHEETDEDREKQRSSRSSSEYAK